MQTIYRPEYYDFLYEKSSRNRILVTAKTLFASLGYDNSSTASIARNAGTSESQLMKHFGGKAGLLDAIFTEGWERINSQLAERFGSVQSLNARLSCIPEVVFAALDRDPELRTLVLLEGHRMRESARTGGEQRGYSRFPGLIDAAIEEARRDGEFGGSAVPLRSALVGMIEEGVREEVLASRSDFTAQFDAAAYGKLFQAFLRNAATQKVAHAIQ